MISSIKRISSSLELIIASEDLDSDRIQLLLKKLIPNYKSRYFESPIKKDIIPFGIKGFKLSKEATLMLSSFSRSSVAKTSKSNCVLNL